MTRWECSCSIIKSCSYIFLQVEKAYAQLREFMLPTLAKLEEQGSSGEKVI